MLKICTCQINKCLFWAFGNTSFFGVVYDKKTSLT